MTTPTVVPVHVTIPYPHPRPKRAGDAGTWLVTTRNGSFVSTEQFATEEEAATFAIEARDRIHGRAA